MNDEQIQQLYDKWFYKFATKEPDDTYTLVVHEVHDGDAYTEFEKLVKTLIASAVVEALETMPDSICECASCQVRRQLLAALTRGQRG